MMIKLFHRLVAVFPSVACHLPEFQTMHTTYSGLGYVLAPIFIVVCLLLNALRTTQDVPIGGGALPCRTPAASGCTHTHTQR